MQSGYSRKIRWQGKGWFILVILVLGVLLQTWSSFAVSRANTANRFTATEAFAQIKQEVQDLQAQLQYEVSAWGEQHLFTNSFDGQTYSQDYEYDNQHGIGGPLWLQGELRSQSYQQAKNSLQTWLYNFQEMAMNFDDPRSPNQPHQADLNLLQHYGDMGKRVVIISLGEQVLRAYDDGNLVNAFPVTTGEPSLPTPPGVWSVEAKLHPTTFTSSAPKNSPDWYPPTKINYAMQFHNNGYYLHDAWWRTQFGPESNYPHPDQGVNGNPLASQGSHGCVDMPTSDATWLYGFVVPGTPVIIY